MNNKKMKFNLEFLTNSKQPLSPEQQLEKLH